MILTESLEQFRARIVLDHKADPEKIKREATALVSARDRLAERRQRWEAQLAETELEYHDLSQKAYEADHLSRFGF